MLVCLRAECCVGRLAYWLQRVSGALICSASEHYKTLVIYRGHENKLFRCTSFYIDIGSTADELQKLWLWDTSNIYSHYIFSIYLVTFLSDYVKCQPHDQLSLLIIFYFTQLSSRMVLLWMSGAVDLSQRTFINFFFFGSCVKHICQGQK